MNLYLMQHGACYSEQIDPERALSPVGQDQVKASALAMKAMGLTFDLMLCGAKKRAVQTAGIVARALGFPEQALLPSPALRPTATALEMIALLEEHKDRESVFIAGHLPGLAVLASALISSAKVGLHFENAGLTRLDVAHLAPHGATLIFHLLPAQLHLMAPGKKRV